eukprot:4717774-Pyramimonas_sp.AAC.1
MLPRPPRGIKRIPEAPKNPPGAPRGLQHNFQGAPEEALVHVIVIVPYHLSHSPHPCRPTPPPSHPLYQPHPYPPP